MFIKQNVLEILQSQIRVEENQVKITGSLDRAQYLGLNQVLEALGGKWNRKAKAHVFPGSFQGLKERIESVISSGAVTTAADLCFFPTPPDLARKMVDIAGVKEEHLVLEPSAGTGAIVRAIKNVYAHVVVCEMDDTRRRECAKVLETYAKEESALGFHSSFTFKPMVRDRVLEETDFMRLKADFQVDAVVMNPPFSKVGDGDCIAHVRNAYRFLTDNGCLVSVMPESIMWRKDKRFAEFRSWARSRANPRPGDFLPYMTSPEMIHVRSSPFVNLPDNTFADSGTKVRTILCRVYKRPDFDHDQAPG